MSYLDGVSFGNDEISSDPNLPYMYDPSDWDGRTILLTNNEFPQERAVENLAQIPKITDQSLLKPVVRIGPSRSITQALHGIEDTKELMTDVRKKFGQITIACNENLLTILVMLFVLIVAMQIKMYMTISTMQGHGSGIGSHHYHNHPMAVPV